MAESPKAVTRDQSFLAAIVDRLDRQNELLADVRDRLPEPAGGAETGTVELTEPARPGATAMAEPAAEPATQPAGKPAAAKSTASKPAAAKKSGKATGTGRKRTTRAKPPEGNS